MKRLFGLLLLAPLVASAEALIDHVYPLHAGFRFSHADLSRGVGLKSDLRNRKTTCDRHSQIRDGDPIVVSGVPIRLQGVAAPESKDKWGRASKKTMEQIVAGQRLRCELTGQKSHDREVGVCYLVDGTDIGAAIITEGLARDCSRYSGGRYEAYETQKRRTSPCPKYCRRR